MSGQGQQQPADTTASDGTQEGIAAAAPAPSSAAPESGPRSTARPEARGDNERMTAYSALARLHQASSRLVSNDDLGTLLQDVILAAVAVSDAQMGYVKIADETSQAWSFAAQYGFRQDYIEQLDSLGERSAAWSEALRQGKRVIVEEVANSPLLRNTKWLPLMEAAGIQATQATPMMARDGRLLGVLSTHWTRTNRPSDDTLLILDLLARHAADLIEHRQRERALREAARHKDAFLAMLGHELRNPLTPIALILGSIKRRGDDPFRKEHETIGRQVRHMMRLVDDLLDITRIARGTFKLRTRPISLKNVVALALQIAMPLIEKRRHHLDIRIPRLFLDGDEERLAQVVANLLTNAARYTPRGGQIVLQAEQRGGEIILTVKDNGIGMTPEFLPRAFNVFAQADDASDTMRGGLGLGLAIVSHIVDLHGGSVEAASEGIGKGSLFTVRVPVAGGHKAAGITQTSATPDRRDRQWRILLVDDNEDVLEWLPKLLQKCGHSVAAAKDGAGALLIAKTFVPQIAILDLGLPGMDGHEIARRLRRELGEAAPQLIALTGYGQDSSLERCMKEGFVAYVTKPNIDQLLQAIDACAEAAPVPSG